MIRKTCIFITLLSAYLLVLGHDLVPHHHHDHHTEIAGHHHDHDGKAPADHHHEHPESEPDDHHNELPEFFSHFVHEVYYPVSGNSSLEVPVKIKDQPCVAPVHDWQLKVIIPVAVAHHPPDDERSPSGFLSPSRSLRAPPVC